MQAIADARTRKGERPAEQLFWELHPVMDWLLDRLLVGFGRHEAPVVLSPTCPPGDTINLFQGILSNQRSQPVISDWFGIRASGDWAWAFLKIEEVMERSGFAAGLLQPAGLAGRRRPRPRPAAPSVGRGQHMARKRGSEWRDAELKRLSDDMRRLSRWHEAALNRLDAEAAGAIGAKAARLAHQRHEVEGRYADRERSIRDTFTTVDAPYLRLVAVFCPS